MQDFRRTPASEYVLPTQTESRQSKKSSQFGFLKKAVPNDEEQKTNNEGQKPNNEEQKTNESSPQEVDEIKKKKSRNTLKEQKTLLNKKIKAYEEENVELGRKCKELQNKFNETQNNLKKVSNMLDKLQKTTVELSSVNSLVFKALRYGCGVCILIQATSLKVNMKFLLRSWRRLMFNAFGNRALKKNQSSYTLNRFTSNHITLLRTEQLLLLQENSYLLNQVELLQKALKLSPQKAAKIFVEFSKSFNTFERKTSSELPHTSVSTYTPEARQKSSATMRLLLSHFTLILECHIRQQILKTFHTLQRACKLSPFMYAGALTFVYSIRYLIEETLQENFCIFQREIQHKRRYDIQDLHNDLIKKKETHITRQCPNKTSISHSCLCTNLSPTENVLVTPNYYYRFPSVVQWMEDTLYRT